MNGILYFSSTGNSLFIAQKVKDSLGGEVKYIPNYHGNGSEYDRLFIVTPIYSYGMPTFICELFERLDKTKEIIVIQNYGGMVGGADYLLLKYGQRLGLNIKAVYTMKMPENFTLTFSVPKFYLNSTLKKADGRIKKIISRIKNLDYHLPKKCKTKEKTYLKNKSNWHKIGERFSVDENCIKCQKCIAVCPVKNISMKDGNICFSDKCVACLGCYHRCPKKAIIYLNKHKKSRYINPKIDENLIGKDF